MSASSSDTEETQGSKQKAESRKDGAYSSRLKAQFVVVVILLTATLALSQSIDFRENIPSSKPFSEFPLNVDRWSADQRQSMEQKFIDALDLSDYVVADYENDGGKRVNLYVAYYKSQSKGESIHSPATCLPGSGWTFEQSGTVSIPMSSGKGTFINVNRAFMKKAGHKRLVYYWFPQRGRILTNVYQLKIYTFWDALIKQRTDGALVRLITTVSDSEKLEEAETRLQEFIRNIIPVLDEYIPGKDLE